jgi:predicted MFS family arabinose efflux permease
MLIQAVCLAIAAPFLLAFLAPPSLALLVVCIVLFSFFNRAANNNETPLMCDLLPPRLRSTALGLFNAFNTFAGGIGVWVAGTLKATAGLAGVFAGISGIIVIAAALAAIGYTFFLKKDLERTQV